MPLMNYFNMYFYGIFIQPSNRELFSTATGFNWHNILYFIKK